MCTEKTLDDIFNRLQDRNNTKNCYYYSICQSQEDTCQSQEVSPILDAYSFILYYFRTGKKDYIFKEIKGELSKKTFIMRSEHMRSVFLIGIDIYDHNANLHDSINKRLSLLFKTIIREDAYNRKKYPNAISEEIPFPYNQKQLNEYLLRNNFLYIWYLICLFHDVGYIYENKSISNNSFVGNYKKIEKTIDGIPEAYFDTCDTYYEKRLNTELLGGRQCIDHGIYGGQLLYNKLEKHHKSEYIIDKEYEDKSSLLWGKPILNNYILHAAWCIMAHNMYLAKEGSHDAKKYEDLKLSKLIYTPKNSLILPSSHPFLFLLSLVDTIEPIKHFITDFSSSNNLKSSIKGKANAIISKQIENILKEICLLYTDNKVSLLIKSKETSEKECHSKKSCQFFEDSKHYSIYGCNRQIANALEYLESREFKVTADEKSLNLEIKL